MPTGAGFRIESTVPRDALDGLCPTREDMVAEGIGLALSVFSECMFSLLVALHICAWRCLVAFGYRFFRIGFAFIAFCFFSSSMTLGSDVSALDQRGNPWIKLEIEEEQRRFEEYENLQSFLIRHTQSSDQRVRLASELFIKRRDHLNRLAPLAESEPDSLAAKSACVKIVELEFGLFPPSEALKSACKLLSVYHADDPAVAILANETIICPDAIRDEFMEGLLSRAVSHESKGIVRAAMAKYLMNKADYVDDARREPDSKSIRMIRVVPNKPKEWATIPRTEQEIAYWHRLSEMDPSALRQRAMRLAHEVRDSYASIPFDTAGAKRIRNLVESRRSQDGGQCLSDNIIDEISISSKRNDTTLGDEIGYLDRKATMLPDLMPAPEIDGLTMGSNRLRLSDFRGKLVVISFWGTWCGPCMKSIPSHKEMISKYKDKPFVFLGINCDEDREYAIKVMREKGMTWPNWHDGAPGDGQIQKAYDVSGFPSKFVIDPKGRLRRYRAPLETFDYWGVASSRRKGILAFDEFIDLILEEFEEKNTNKNTVSNHATQNSTTDD